MSEDAKIRENRLRSMARRQGLTLAKSRRRDPRALDYGTYCLLRVETAGGHWRGRALVAGDQNTGYGMSLDDIERALTEPRP